MIYRLNTALLGLLLLAFPVLPAVVAHAEERSTVEYLSPFEAEVITEINRARTNPLDYASLLEALRPYFRGNRLELPGEIPLVTQEGVEAVHEAIGFLRAATPLAPLSPSRGMSLAAKDHARDQGASAYVGHAGRDGSTSWERINRYGRWQEVVAENISYGASSARDVVMKLITDDGVPSRGHRINLFNPQLRVVGVGCGKHASYRTMCVITLAGAYTEMSN